MPSAMGPADDDVGAVHIDQALADIDSALSDLAQMKVEKAVKERGWSALQRELEGHPVRPAASQPGRAGKSTQSRKAVQGGASQVEAGAASGAHGGVGRARVHTWQWAVGAAVVAAVLITTVAVTAGGEGTQMAGGSGQPTTVPSMAALGGGEPGSAAVEAGTTGNSDDNSVSTTSPGSSQGAAGPSTGTVGTIDGVTTPTSTPTGGATVPGQTPTAPGGSSGSAPGAVTGTTRDTTGTTPTTRAPGTTAGPGVGTSSPSTVPQTTPPTKRQLVTSEQRVNTAEKAVGDLCDLVVNYFATGDLSGASALVAPEAQSSLTQMIRSLKDPYRFQWVGSSKALSANTVRVAVEFTDRVSDGRGELMDVSKLFAFTVQVSDQRAVITAISAGAR